METLKHLKAILKTAEANFDKWSFELQEAELELTRASARFANAHAALVKAQQAIHLRAREAKLNAFERDLIN